MLTAQADPAGYLLLKCYHSYLTLTMYLVLELQTEDTISAREQALLQYSNQLQVNIFITHLHIILIS